MVVKDILTKVGILSAIVGGSLLVAGELFPDSKIVDDRVTYSGFLGGLLMVSVAKDLDKEPV